MDLITRETRDGYFTNNELKEVRKEMVRTKIEDADYVSAHPELTQMIEGLYAEVLGAKPSKKELYGFVASYFDRLNEERIAAMD